MGFCLIEYNGVAMIDDCDTKHKIIKYQRDMYFCDNLIDANGERLIMNGIRKIKIKCPTQKIDIVINNKSIFPDSVTEIIFDCNINGNIVLPEQIKTVTFYDIHIIHKKIYNIVSWPQDVKYSVYSSNILLDISQYIKMIFTINSILPFPIYEEIIENVFIDP